MPKEVEDEVVVGYVKRVAQKIAANSDLQVPLQITVLNSKEINAIFSNESPNWRVSLTSESSEGLTHVAE